MPFTPVHVLNMFAYGISAVAVAAIILGSTILVLRYDRTWPARLLLVGASALFVVAFAEGCFAVAFEHGWVQRSFLMQGCLVSPVLAKPLLVAEAVSYLLFIGLVWYCARAVRNGLTNRSS